ncbi:rab-GTPase-TBC domain-containing protein [Xylariomycetidae sp. FL0641]|nr:rab-GTPase-TBC domain-containing protein [Xylariomycetidae sp. FL0641]
MADLPPSYRVDDAGGPADDRDPPLDARQAPILDACETYDLARLRDLAVAPGGLLSDDLRRQAWPILLGVNPADPAGEFPGGGSDLWRDLPTHRDEGQVKLDVERSFVYYPNGQGTHTTQADLDGKKAELSDLITEVLRRQPYLCYFQGYHDICQVFLLVLPPPARAAAVARLSALRIRDFMLPNLAPAIAQLRLIPDILGAADAALCTHLSRTEPYFALSDTLTMFAHNVQRYRDIARLFDALLARTQVFALYVVAAIILRRRDELFATDEPDMLHFALSKLPADLDLDAVIADAAALFARHPPERLPSWRAISPASVLKTTRDVDACPRQTLADGARYFDKQLAELRWAERRQKLLQTAWSNRAFIFAVLVGVGAVYFRKAPFWAGALNWVLKFTKS